MQKQPPTPSLNITRYAVHMWLSFCSALFKKLLRFVDLSRQVWTSASIGMISNHELSMLLSDHLFGDSSFPNKPVTVSATSTSSAILNEDLRCLEYQSRFSAIHLLFKSSFVECFPKCVGPASVSSECHQTRATLIELADV